MKRKRENFLRGGSRGVNHKVKLRKNTRIKSERVTQDIRKSFFGKTLLNNRDKLSSLLNQYIRYLCTINRSKDKHKRVIYYS